MAFDVAGAISEGYSPTEIADHLAKANKFDAIGARNEGYSDDEIIAHLNEPKTGTPMEALKGGAKQLLSSGRTALESVIDPNKAAVAGLERQQAITEKPGGSWAEVQRIYDEQGVLPAAWEGVKQVPAVIAGQIPQLGGMWAAGTAAAALTPPVLPVVGPFAKPIAGILGGVASLAIPQTGTNIERQAQAQQAAGQPVDVSMAKAVPAALGSAALDEIALISGGLGKVLGIGVKELGTVAAERLAKESLLKASTKGVGKTALSEMPTEITQQMLERAQAGLDLTSPEAIAEYKDAGFQAFLMSPLGGLGGVSSRSQAKGQVAAVQALKDQEAADKAYNLEQAKGYRDQARADRAGSQAAQDEIARQATETKQQAVDVLQQVAAKKQADAGIPSVNELMQTKEGASQLVSDNALFEHHFPKAQYTKEDITQIKNDIRARRNTLPTQESIARDTTQAELEQTFAVDPNTITPEVMDMWGISKGNKKLRNQLLAVGDLTVPDNKVKATEILEDYKQKASPKQFSAAETATQHIASLEPVSVEAPNVELNQQADRTSVPVPDEQRAVSPTGIAGTEQPTLGDVGDSTGLPVGGTELQSATLEESPAAVQARVQARILEKRQAEEQARAEEKAANLASEKAFRLTDNTKPVNTPSGILSSEQQGLADAREAQAREAETSQLADTETNITEQFTPADENIIASAEGKKKPRKPKYAMPARVEPSDTAASVDAVKKELGTLFTPQQLKARPPVVVDTVEELPTHLQEQATEADAAAFVDPTTNQEYYIASKIPSNDIKGKIHHERGAHVGLTKLIGKDRVTALANRVITWATDVNGKKIEHIIAREAHEKALMSGETEGSERYNQEVIAYFTEIAVNRYNIDPLKTQPKEFAKVAGWLRELWNGILNTLKKLHYDPSKLNAKEIVDLVYGAARIANKAEPSAGATQARAATTLTPEAVDSLIQVMGQSRNFGAVPTSEPAKDTRIQASARDLNNKLGFTRPGIDKTFTEMFYDEIKKYGNDENAILKFIGVKLANPDIPKPVVMTVRRLLSQLPKKNLENAINAPWAVSRAWENPEEAAYTLSEDLTNRRKHSVRRGQQYTGTALYSAKEADAAAYPGYLQYKLNILIDDALAKFAMAGNRVVAMTAENEYLPITEYIGSDFVDAMGYGLSQGKPLKQAFEEAYIAIALSDRTPIIEARLGPSLTGWTKFSDPSEAEDLQIVTSDTGSTAGNWCTGRSASHGEAYLADYDMFVYIDKGQTLISTLVDKKTQQPNEWFGLGQGQTVLTQHEHLKNTLPTLDPAAKDRLKLAAKTIAYDDAEKILKKVGAGDANAIEDVLEALEKNSKKASMKIVRDIFWNNYNSTVGEITGVTEYIMRSINDAHDKIRDGNVQLGELFPKLKSLANSDGQVSFRGHATNIANIPETALAPINELIQLYDLNLVPASNLVHHLMGSRTLDAEHAHDSRLYNTLKETLMTADSFTGPNVSIPFREIQDALYAIRQFISEAPLVPVDIKSRVDYDLQPHTNESPVDVQYDNTWGGYALDADDIARRVYSAHGLNWNDKNSSDYVDITAAKEHYVANKAKNIASTISENIKKEIERKATRKAEKEQIQASAAVKGKTLRADGTEIVYHQQEKESLWNNVADVFNGSSTPWRSLMDMLGNKIVTGRYTVERKAIDAGLSATDAKTQGKIRADLIGLQATNAMSLAQAGLFYGKLVLRKSGIIRAENGKVNMIDLGNEWHTLLEKATKELGSADLAYDMLSAGWYGPRYEDLAKHNASTAPKNRVDISDWTESNKQTSAEAWRRYGPELTKLRDMRNEMRGSVLDLMVESGLYTRDVAKEYLDRMDYVPLYRVQEKDLLDKQGRPLRVSTGLLGVGKEFRLRGSQKAANDPLQNYIANMSWMMQRAIKNNAAVHTADMLDALGQGYWSKNKVPSGKKESMYVAEIWKNGESKDFVMYDPNDMAAFAATPIISGLVWDLMRYPVAGLRHGITMMPQFVFNQAMEDPVRAAFVSGNKAGVAQNVRDTWKSIADNQFKAERTPDADMLNRYGVIGQKDILDAKDIEDMYHGNDKKGYRKYIYFLERMAQGSDLGARESIYKNAVKELKAEGYDQDTAEDLASIRSQQYMPYQQVGMSKSLAYLRRMMPFVNPPIQGLARDIAAMRGRLTGVSKADGKKMFALTLTKYAIFTAMYAAFSSGDDDYENKTDDQKDNNFYLGGVRIAVPQELRPLKVAIERGTRYWVLNEPNADVDSAAIAGTVLRKTWEIISGVAMPVPTIARPLVENMANFDIYSARPVVGISQQSKAPMYQYTDTTSELAKVVGEALNYSPIKIDHILRGYFGYMGQTVSQALNVFDTERPTMRLQDWPIIGGFVEGEYGTGPKNELYKLVGKSAEAKATLKAIQKEGNREKAIQWAKDHRGSIGLASAVNALHSQVTRIRDIKSRVSLSNILANEKRTKLDALDKTELRILSNVHKLHQRMNELDA